jgi:hypothetical protein
MSVAVFGALVKWRRDIEDFGRDKLGSAQEAAKKKCREFAGL